MSSVSNPVFVKFIQRPCGIVSFRRFWKPIPNIGNAKFKTNIKNFDVSYGFQSNNESLDISYDDLSRAEFNSDGKILKTADLFFLGGGIDVSKSRRSNALFVEIEKDISDNFVSRFAARYESMNNESSFDPKISFNFNRVRQSVNEGIDKQKQEIKDAFDQEFDNEKNYWYTINNPFRKS